MLAIHVDLLAGRYAASAYNDRQTAEWPPHPARLFSALVATWGEGDPHDNTGNAERAALEWLEQLSAPEIFASLLSDVGARTVAPVFVPVNDTAVVSEPSTDKLNEAEEALAIANTDKDRGKAQKNVDKLRAKLVADTAKAIAPPTSYGKDFDVGLQVLPDRRPKQPRTFPSVTPSVPHVVFFWPDAAPPTEHLRALDRLASRLVRLGHSSSMVRVSISTRVISDDQRATVACYRPADGGDLIIRWVDAGQVQRLVSAYERHRETEQRVLPARFERYTTSPVSIPRALIESAWSDEMVVFARTIGPRLPIVATAGLARQFRRALMAHAGPTIHPALSGHDADGGATKSLHVAIVPLPVVSGPHPDGALIGIAVVFPRALDRTGRDAVNQAIGRLEDDYRDDPYDVPAVRLDLDPTPLWLQRVPWRDGRSTLDPRAWSHASRRWATATPIALDRNPGDLNHSDPAKRARAFDEAADTIVEALAHIGLPKPLELDVVRSCVLPGTAKPRTYPRYPHDPSRAQRVLVHARIVFADPVRGPLLIGAGRYLGLGLCLPVNGDT